MGKKNAALPEAGKESASGFADLKYNKKTVLSLLAFILVMLIAAGIATRLVPQGEFLREKVDGHTVIVEDSFHYLDSNPLPVWRWFTAPFEGLTGDDSSSIIMILLCMFVMGGGLALLDQSKVLVYLVSVIIKKFGNNPYKLMYLMMFVLMLMGSTISFYNQATIFLPLALGICFGVGWDALMGVGMSVTAVAMGFAVSMTNPYTVAIPQTIVGLPVNSGIALRTVLFVVVYVVYTTFLRNYAKRLDADPANSLMKGSDDAIRSIMPSGVDEEVLKDRKVRKGTFAFCGSIVLMVLYTVLTLLVSALASTTLLAMMLCLSLGIGVSAKVSGRIPKGGIWRGFLKGIRLVAPNALVLVLIMGIREIIVKGNIMDTILYFAYQGVAGMSPYLAIFVILGITMAFELVVGSATTKAFLILPLLVPLGNMIGLTSQTIVQAYMFGDGFTNSFYPTSTTLLMVTGLVGIPLNKWYRWTWKLLLAVMVIVAVTLLICVKINFGPF